MDVPRFLQSEHNAKHHSLLAKIALILFITTAGFFYFPNNTTNYNCWKQPTIGIYRDARRCLSPWFVYAGVSTFLQSKSYSSSSALSDHPITLDTTVTSQGGTICPSGFIAVLSYGGATGDLCTSITDTDGNTWAKAKSTTNSTNTNAEVWYAINVVGGGKPTITAHFSSATTLTAYVVEMDQMAPLRGYDNGNARVDATSSTLRKSATTATKRTGTHAVNIKAWAWTDASLTISNPGTSITGLVQVKDGTTNIACGIARHSVERNVVGGSAFTGNATMSASTTVPVACFDLTFYRDGVVTTTDQDGTTDNLEGVVTVATTNIATTTVWGCDASYKSSTSAPYGGTGGSETDKLYAFWQDYSSYLKAGVTIGTTFDVNLVSTGGFDDGQGYMGGFMYVFKNGTFGSTLDSTDDSFAGTPAVNMGVPAASGLQTYTMDTATYFNTSGYTTMAIQMEGDSNGFQSGSVLCYSDYDMNAPAFLQLTLNYPILAAIKDPIINTGGVIPFPR